MTKAATPLPDGISGRRCARDFRRLHPTFRIGKALRLACAMALAAILVSNVSVAPLRAQNETPGTPPLKGTPAPDDNNKPAESKPGGTRPTDPAPEPAHPAPEAEKKGAKQALPPAPAEKIAPPIKEK
jgi:hypothetical protein